MTQEFLNEAKLPFKYCTREQQHILLDALIDGTIEYWGDLTKDFVPGISIKNLDGLNLHTVFRTKPLKRLAIPWEHIKPEYRWAAISSIGFVNLFTEKPKLSIDNGAWIYEGILSSASNILNIDTSGINWRDSLVERPDDK